MASLIYKGLKGGKVNEKKFGRKKKDVGEEYKLGSKAILCGFGAGMTWGAAVVRLREGIC